MANILTGEYTLGQVDEYECIILATKKEDVPAAVVLTPKVRMLLERIKTHKHVGPKEFKDMADGKGNNKYNEAIRRITKKAGLDRIIVKIDTNKIVEKKPEKKPLYKVITNQDDIDKLDAISGSTYSSDALKNIVKKVLSEELK